MKKRLYLLLLLCSFYTATIVAQLAPDCGGLIDQVPPAESCPETCIYCSFPGTFQGSSIGYTANAVPPGGFCGTIDNDLWMGFIAHDNSGSITITPSNCVHGNGLEAALYDKCSSAPIACVAGQAGGGNTPLSLTANLLAGKNYFLMIDGYDGDECDFTVSAPVMAQPSPGVGAVQPIQGPSKICPGGVVAFEVPPVAGAGAYFWTSTTPDVTFNGLAYPAVFDAPEGHKVKVAFPLNVTGKVSLCVSVANTCNLGSQSCKTIDVQPIPKKVFPPIFICQEDFPVIINLPWGESVWAYGGMVYTKEYKSYLGCDSILTQNVNGVYIPVTNLGTKYICAGDSLKIGTHVFKSNQSIAEVLQSYQGCDSLVSAYLFVLDKLWVLPSSNLTLSCKTTEITLKAASNSNTTWKSGKGKVLGQGPSFQIKSPGIYYATGTTSLGGVSCPSEVQITVKSNTQPPAPLTITVNGFITPNSPYVQLKAKSISSGLQYSWTGPSGFTSTLKDPVVSVPGTYTVVATDKSNGCTTSASVEVAKM